MSTQHAVSTQQDSVQEELKSERVQEPLATFRTQLKSERVQEELAPAGEEEAKLASIELAVYQPQTVTIEVFAAKVTITLHGPSAVDNAGVAG